MGGVGWGADAGASGIRRQTLMAACDHEGMKNRLVALAVATLALAALAGCTAGASDSAATPGAPGATSSPTASSTPDPSVAPDASSTPGFTTPAGVEVPDGFVSATKDLFADSDPATAFEGAQMLCLLLDGVDGDMEKMGALMQSEVGLSREQTLVLLPLAVEYACPMWADNYNGWATEGGPSRL